MGEGRELLEKEQRSCVGVCWGHLEGVMTFGVDTDGLLPPSEFCEDFPLAGPH